MYAENPHCHWCGERMVLQPKPDTPEVEEMATLEHLVARSAGGSNDPVNIVLAHKRCNR